MLPSSDVSVSEASSGLESHSSSCVPARPLRSGARAAAAAGQRLAVHDIAHEELARLLVGQDGEVQAVRVADARRGHVSLKTFSKTVSAP